jgi:hypothetical protein
MVLVASPACSKPKLLEDRCIRHDLAPHSRCIEFSFSSEQTFLKEAGKRENVNYTLLASLGRTFAFSLDAEINSHG